MVGERGFTLSGGQRQRLAIARTLVVNPPILVLDDATSAIDVQIEQQIHEALRGLMADRTTMIIAHRLSTISLADQVAVVEGGRVIAEGTHAELLASEPRYAEILAQSDADAELDDDDDGTSFVAAAVDADVARSRVLDADRRRDAGRRLMRPNDRREPVRRDAVADSSGASGAARQRANDREPVRRDAVAESSGASGAARQRANDREPVRRDAVAESSGASGAARQRANDREPGIPARRERAN